MTVLVCGDVGFERLRLPDGTRSDRVGGSALYAALAASIVGQPRLLAAVGTDFSIAEAGRDFGDAVDMSLMQQHDGRSFCITGRYVEGGRLVIARGERGPRLDISKCDGTRGNVLVCPSGDPRSQCDAAERLAPRLVLVSPGIGWARVYPQEVARLIALAHIVMISHFERAFLADSCDLDSVTGVLVVTEGASGVTVRHEGAELHVPAPCVQADEVIDQTGAGDALLGSVAAFLAAAMDRRVTKEATADAIGAASWVVAEKLRSRGSFDFACRLRDASPRLDDA